ncbi:MAG: hypothetical protein RL033_115 [Pseudomonadota bacterium]
MSTCRGNRPSLASALPLEPLEASRWLSYSLRVTGVDVVGWVSSLILLVTLGQQVRKQWRSRESRGVSTWLFVGQMAASVGFAVYSYLLDNWVFLFTNLALLANAMLGEWVTLRNRRAARASSAPGSEPRSEPRSEPALARQKQPS